MQWKNKYVATVESKGDDPILDYRYCKKWAMSLQCLQLAAQKGKCTTAAIVIEVLYITVFKSLQSNVVDI
jgi:hypothetical protein